MNSTYGNKNTIAYQYDSLDRKVSTTIDGKLVANYKYDNVGNLAILKDVRSGITYNYTYDLSNRLVKTEDSKGNYYKTDYDSMNRTSKRESFVAGKSYINSFEFDKDGKTTKISLPSNRSIGYKYDSIGRNNEKTLNFGNSKTFKVEYKYKDGYAGSSTNLLQSIKNNGKEIKYTYDNLGRIETIDNGKKIKYYYDGLGQVIREDNGELDKTIVYTYDQTGNILKVTEYKLTSSANLGTATSSKAYKYGDTNWTDKLTNYNGKDITYDEIGNPLTYDGYTFSWIGGRTLRSISGNGKTIIYNHNSEGIRTQKTVNGVKYKYTLDGNNVAHEEIVGADGKTTDKIYYNYGDNGLISFNLNGTDYFYEKNAQGDIIGILDTNGVEVVKYTYDTWGKLVSITGNKVLGEKNPYRYRGYRYDAETGYYYLQSRYYNPEIGRFINADGTTSTGQGTIGNNMFTYCLNNPINRNDSSGYASVSLIDIARIAISSKYTNEEKAHEFGRILSGRGVTIGFKEILKPTTSTLMDSGTGRIADILIKEKMVFKEIPGAKYGLSRYTSNLSTAAKFGKKFLGVSASAVFTVWDVKTSISKGEYYGAFLDGLGGVLGIGVGLAIGYVGCGALATGIISVMVCSVISGLIENEKYEYYGK